MKKETLAKIAIASALCAPACTTERGVIVHKQELPEENALYINLIRNNKAQQKPLEIKSDEIFVADRKLTFPDSTYIGLFDYFITGDTIAVFNPSHSTYLRMNNKKLIREINGAKGKDLAFLMRLALQKQK